MSADPTFLMLSAGVRSRPASSGTDRGITPVAGSDTPFFLWLGELSWAFICARSEGRGTGSVLRLRSSKVLAMAGDVW